MQVTTFNSYKKNVHHNILYRSLGLFFRGDHLANAGGSGGSAGGGGGGSTSVLRHTGGLIAAAGGGGGAGNAESCCAHGGAGGGESGGDGGSPGLDLAVVEGSETCDNGWCSADSSQVRVLLGLRVEPNPTRFGLLLLL